MELVKFLCLWSLLLLFSCSSAIPVEDWSALLAFKEEITQDPLGALSSWNDTNRICEWNRVSCGSGGPPWKVVSLNLSSFNLAGSLTPSIGNLTSLKLLDLSNNGIYGEIPTQLGKLNQLEALDLSLNKLQGEIPDTITNCSNLQILDLDSNQLVGRIPPGIGALTKLKLFHVANNSLTGPIPTTISNNTNLEHLILMLNNLHGPIPEGIGNLKSLNFFEVSVNNISGSLPPQLFNISSIWYLAVAVNRLQGTLPADIGIAMPNLQSLIIGSNFIHGSIPPSLSNASNLEMISMSYNNISGTVPSNLGNLEELIELDLESNALQNDDNNSWEFLRSLTKCRNLQKLFLPGNYFEGDLPSFLADLSPDIQELYLGGNIITGSIPGGIGNLSKLIALSIPHNNLTGNIPSSITKLNNLQEMDLGENNLNGEIPSDIGNLSQLVYMYLEGNNLEGPIPPGVGNLQTLEALYLSYNNFNQTLPIEVFKLSAAYIILENNALTGTLPVEIGNMQNLLSFEISENYLFGEIPASIGNCIVLQRLGMSQNSINGTIPQSLNNLRGMVYLNLSHNYLSGSILGLMENMPFLVFLDLSFNQLEGEVPNQGVFQNATITSLGRNKGLCGGVSALNLPPCPIPPSPPPLPRKRSFKPLTIGSLLAFFITWLLLYTFLCFKNPKKQTMQVDEQLYTNSSLNYYPQVTYTELFEATNGFSTTNLTGSGSHSSVYQGVLGNSKNKVAVKIFNLQCKRASESFKSEQATLGSIRHRNIVKIISSCDEFNSSGEEFKAIVYEFFPNGSLDSWLHQNTSNDSYEARGLTFIKRLGIAINVAEALEYLHNGSQNAIAHCDLKPSNVLLDDDMNAQLADFGLARFLTTTTTKKPFSGPSTSSIGIKGTLGYIAPEYGSGGRPSADRVKEISDPRVLVLEDEDDGEKGISETALRCLDSVLRAGLSCSEPNPTERMKIGDVKILLAEIMEEMRPQGRISMAAIEEL